jgi:glycosyltransferase involved in cell wall biosynthesis
VIVSNGGALPEVVGDSGEIVNFYKDRLSDRLLDVSFVDDLSNRILAVLQDKKRQAEMAEKGRKRAILNSWDEVAEKTIDVYKKVAG